MDDLVSTVANLGFPIALSMYLLVRIEMKMEKLTGAIAELSKSLKCDI